MNITNDCDQYVYMEIVLVSIGSQVIANREGGIRREIEIKEEFTKEFNVLKIELDRPVRPIEPGIGQVFDSIHY